MTKLSIDYDLCDECGTCVEVCPAQIIVMNGKHIEIDDPDSCMECRLCEVECPRLATKLVSL